jgi:hypothetical protein
LKKGEEKMTTEPKEGFWKARGVPGSEQLIDSQTGTPGLAVDLKFSELGDLVMTTTMYITSTSWRYIAERLRAMGWKGNDTSELTKAHLARIGDNEVTARVWPDKYKDPKDGKEKVNWKCEVANRGAGHITYEKKLDEATWLARVKLAVGNAAGGAGAADLGDSPPPF